MIKGHPFSMEMMPFLAFLSLIPYSGMMNINGHVGGYSYNTYGREGFPMGARVIHLHEDKDDFDIYIRMDDGSVITYQDNHLS